jgi:shikimate 5-dehydrogenase
MNQTQLHAILNILKRIHTEPFIEYDEAVEEILHLETAGFEVSPPHFKYVADLLNG